ncbi:MAG: hypothetical protein KC877_04650 [Candidatus Kaiserbacteria bacterium]|nr:hypothetical protein [Candidatus Kaiserbacteria bacterium]MCB9816608.1 hypothetical protein [Candidatus Nomurabacteria bacterium]
MSASTANPAQSIVFLQTKLEVLNVQVQDQTMARHLTAEQKRAINHQRRTLWLQIAELQKQVSIA